MNDVTIVVATHKKSEMPSDVMYLPLHVGAEGKYNSDGTPLDFGYAKDNTGDNISERNSTFGSQTGLYWAWKNLDSDYIGLVHYRRHFAGKNKKKNDIVGSAITYDELKPMLVKYKVFAPKKRHYYIESLYSHYCHTINGGKEQLDTTREILAEKYPSYLTAFDNVMGRRWGYMFNIMILQKDLLDSYCTWLFDVLFDLAERIDTTGMSDFDRRFCGRVSELMFDIWLEQTLLHGNLKKEDIKEIPYMEDVNWNYKIRTFLSAKLFHKKYEASA